MNTEIKYDGKIPCRLDHNGECLICVGYLIVLMIDIWKRIINGKLKKN
jgi:hypothetical protein